MDIRPDYSGKGVPEFPPNQQGMINLQLAQLEQTVKNYESSLRNGGNPEGLKADYQKIVDGFGAVGKGLAWIGGLFDTYVIDKFLVDGEGKLADRLGVAVRKVQSGLAQSYLFWMAAGLATMLLWISQVFK